MNSCYAIVTAATAMLVVFGTQADAQTKYLIIHADDAGMSHSVNQATIEAMEQGIVSSASIMVPCPWFPEFARYAAAHPEKDFGIHLTLNSEWDVYRWPPVLGRAEVPSLVDKQGFLWDDVAQVAENAKADEVERELRAQIERAKSFHVPLSHLDTHMGALISRPDLLEVYVRLGLEYNLPVLFLRTAPEPVAQQYPALVERGATLLKHLDEHALPVLDHLEQFYGGETEEERRATYEGFLRQVQPGLTELIIHCGYDNEELRGITNSSRRRDGDRQFFCDPRTAKLVQELGLNIVTWKQMHDRLREAK